MSRAGGALDSMRRRAHDATKMRSAPSALGLVIVLLIVVTAGGGGCSEFVKPVLPGETAYAVEEIAWSGVTLDHALLNPTLSVRADSLIIPGQPYNPYRLAEDRRRVAAFWKNFGYFDVTVDKADVAFDEQTKTVKVLWTVHEGPRYALRSVGVTGAAHASRGRRQPTSRSERVRRNIRVFPVRSVGSIPF